MKDLAFIPSINDITNTVNGTIGLQKGSSGISASSSPGAIISSVLSEGLIVAGFLMFVWAIIGAFQYILAGGNKENLAKARERITWAIVGFLLVIVSFAISSYIQGVFLSSGTYTNP